MFQPFRGPLVAFLVILPQEEGLSTGFPMDQTYEVLIDVMVGDEEFGGPDNRLVHFSFSK